MHEFHIGLKLRVHVIIFRRRYLNYVFSFGIQTLYRVDNNRRDKNPAPAKKFWPNFFFYHLVNDLHK